MAAALLLTNTVFASDMYATRGETADMLLSAADDYKKDVKRSDIIKGYGGDGELHEDWNINRAEALVMLSRAFGTLPALTGHNARVALKSSDFTDIPDWEKPELTPVLDAGIAAGTADGIFSPYDDVTKEQKELFIKRAYALFGTNEKDDFYAAVNHDTLNELTLKPGRMMADGGSYFDNILEIAKANMKYTSALQGTAPDKTKWGMYPYTVNACYSATANDITFPAAILQPPMYDVNASYEENLVAIGYIIAHEITHAFDNNGAKFDENGNAADWWTKEDYAEFEKRCEKMVYFYDRQEGIPGVPMNGRQTLSENVSDQGAVQCVTEVASRLENPDYQKLYHSMAKAWASTKTREYAKYAAGVDVHSEDKLRVNRVVVNCDAFYTAFGITEKDGMWVASAERVKIW